MQRILADERPKKEKMPQFSFRIRIWFSLPRDAQDYIRTNYPQVTSISNTNGCLIEGIVTAGDQSSAEAVINGAIADIKNKMVQKTITPL